MIELVIRCWRITRGIPGGSHIWFDPKCEAVKLYRIPPSEQQKDLSEVGEVDDGGDPGYLDKVDSVSENGPDRAIYVHDRYEQLSVAESDPELPF